MKFLNCPKIILLSGTPGTGKSTIGRIIAENLNCSVFNLGEFIIKHGLYENEESNTAVKNINEETADIECVLELFRIYLNKNEVLYDVNDETKLKPIIVDSHYADIILDGIRVFNQNPEFYLEKLELNSDNSAKIHCILEYTNEKNIYGIILRCDPSELEIRLNKRDYTRDKIQENIQAEILGESTSNMLEVLAKENIYEIDTSVYGESKSCEIIKKILLNPDKNREAFGYGTINWIRNLAKEGRLNEYFKNKLGLKRIVTDFQDVDKLD